LLDEISKYEDTANKKVQFFYSGKMMELDKPVGTYLKEDGVVSVFLRKVPS
jgi:hypothetical protein